MTPKEELKMIIEQVKMLFEAERGKDEAKKESLRNTVTAKVETPLIL